MAGREARTEQLGAAFEAWLLEHPELTADQRRLLNMVGEQIRAEAEAGGVGPFELYRFIDPPFSLRGGLARAEELFGGRERLESVLTGLNAAVLAPPDAPSGAHNTQVQ